MVTEVPVASLMALVLARERENSIVVPFQKHRILIDDFEGHTKAPDVVAAFNGIEPLPVP